MAVGRPARANSHEPGEPGELRELRELRAELNELRGLHHRWGAS